MADGLIDHGQSAQTKDQKNEHRAIDLRLRISSPKLDIKTNK